MPNTNLPWAHPLVRTWFQHHFQNPTEPQVAGWPSILAGQTTLISAPTGSGKTLAAFLACIDQLVRKSLKSELLNETEVLYVSPLKALSNDIEKNLTQPLNEMMLLAKEQHLKMAEIRVAVRTGDTPARDRLKMLKKPPHILVTTPESLFILLTAEKSRQMLSSVKTIIVDEIHALVNDKRGAHLALSLERLEAITSIKPVRIGLSATQRPIEAVAAFLAAKRENSKIIQIGHLRKLDLAVEVPKTELSSIASNEMWDEIYDQLAEFSQEHRSTLVFVNTRRLAERVAHHLSTRLGDNQVLAHHGSLSRKLRLAAETKLKSGELKVLVATASLELGIDIGAIDLVCQIGSTRSIAVALQRIGRAGHWYGAIPKGRLFATTRDELIECAALVQSIRQGELDALVMPVQPLDILAQQIIAASATNEWNEEDLFLLVKRAYPYRNLSRETFNAILEMLANGVAGSRGRYGAYIHRDLINGKIRGRRSARLTAITSGGAIPENGLFSVIANPNGVMVGTLDEDFAVESNRGDIILLGTTSWQIQKVESLGGKVIVEDAHGAPPSVPFWRGEAPARTKELSKALANLRYKIAHLLSPNILTMTEWSETTKHPALSFLQQECGLSAYAATQFIQYILEGLRLLGHLPTQKVIIAERFFDEGGGMQLIIHSPFGARINKAWGLALRKKFCRSFNFELQAAATDNGLNISLTEQHSFPLSDVFKFLSSKTIKEVLIQAILQTPLFTTRWRWTATRALALVRFRNGKKVPPNIQRMLSDDLLAAVFPQAAACQDNLGGLDIVLPSHPLIDETMKDILNDALDLEGLTHLLSDMENGNIACYAIDTPLPSVFAHEILNANPYAYLDDAPLEERRARAVEMRRVLPQAVLQEIGKLDPEAIKEVVRQAWPDIRNADELHDALLDFVVFPMHANLIQSISIWESYFAELVNTQRAATIIINNQTYWYLKEKSAIVAAIYPAILSVKHNAIDHMDALIDMLRGWFLHLGPTNAYELSDLLNLDLAKVEIALLRLESNGFILRGQFSTLERIEWCERRLLARIHRFTLNKLRKKITAIDANQFINWLAAWQHVSPGTQLQGELGLLQIIKQLQGFEAPANTWEKQIFAKRIHDYEKSMLDHLCLSGLVGWGRLSPHPAMFAEEELKSPSLPTKKVIPTSIVPLTFFIRFETKWFLPLKNTDKKLHHLSTTAQKIYEYLQKKGASFFANIVQSIPQLKSQIEMALWELIAAGLISADGFDSLRALIDPHRRLNKGRGRLRFISGRWSVLELEQSDEETKYFEAVCWMLLKRYGVIFRDLLSREKNIPKWRLLLPTLRRLENQGEIRGGVFVSGFVGEQYALPYAIESLRSMRHTKPSTEAITLCAADPLNLGGIILPGKRISAFSKKTITLPSFKNPL